MSAQKFKGFLQGMIVGAVECAGGISLFSYMVEFRILDWRVPTLVGGVIALVCGLVLADISMWEATIKRAQESAPAPQTDRGEG